MRDDIKSRSNGSTRARVNRRICVGGGKTVHWVGLLTLFPFQTGGKAGGLALRCTSRREA